MASIEKRSSSSFRITVARDENGQTIRFRKIIKGDFNSKELDRIAREFEVEVDSGLHTSTLMGATVSVFAKQYVSEHVQEKLAPSTQESYQLYLNKHILPYIGEIKIKELRSLDVIKLYKALKANGLSPRSLKYAHQVLSSMLSRAVYWQVIPRNPCESVEPPKYDSGEIHFYDAEQAGKLLACLESVPPNNMKYRVAATLALFTTMRRSEVLALEWSDIDLYKQIISINKTLHWSATRGFVVSGTKTEKSRRKVDIGRYTVDLLREYKKQQAAEILKAGRVYQRSDRVFTREDGSMIPPYLLSAWFTRFINANNLPPLTFHGLRHTAVTNMIAGGFDIATASEIAGHSDKTTTANIYLHAIDQNRKRAINDLEMRIVSNK